MKDLIESLVAKDKELAERFQELQRKHEILDMRVDVLQQMKKENLAEMQETIDARKQIMRLLEELQTILKGV